MLNDKWGNEKIKVTKEQWTDKTDIVTRTSRTILKTKQTSFFNLQIQNLTIVKRLDYKHRPRTQNLVFWAIISDNLYFSNVIIIHSSVLSHKNNNFWFTLTFTKLVLHSCTTLMAYIHMKTYKQNYDPVQWLHLLDDLT